MALEVKRQASEEALEYLEELLNRKLSAREMLNLLIEDIVSWTEANWRLLDVFCSQRFSPLVNRDESQECKPEPMMLGLDAIIARGQEQGIYRQDIDRAMVAHILDLAILCEQYRWAKTGRPQGVLKENLERCIDFACTVLRIRKIVRSRSLLCLSFYGKKRSGSINRGRLRSPYASLREKPWSVRLER